MLTSATSSTHSQMPAYYGAPVVRATPLPESLGEIGGGAPSNEASLSFRDVLDAINPLNHIPIISDLLAESTGHEVSAGAKLAGGTLFGGPIGFIASLVNVIFEGETGKTPAGAAFAALSGESPATQLASQDATSIGTPVAGAASPVVPVLSASVQAPALAPRSDKAEAILALYGASVPSAHASYRNAQLRPYLTDVTVSKVL